MTMHRKFSHFVIFAEMRTGSNFLERNLNQFDDIESHGELYNPHFIGGANKDELFGISLKERENDPLALLEAVRASNKDKIPGFRFFNDHDPRILQKCLEDPECGKVILTRNPLESYVSRMIAGVTGQWRLTNLKHQKTAKIEFDKDEFSEHLQKIQDFQIVLLNALQTHGQTAFYINYDDINSLDVLNGMARFLGSDHQVENINRDLKRQNPSTLQNKVANYAEMQAALAKIDFMDLSRTPNFEPRRGAAVPRLIAGDKTPLLFLPIKGAPVDAIKTWIAGHDGTTEAQLITGMNQRDLKDWRENRPGFQMFTVLRHPVARAYHSFCSYILPLDKGAYRDIRKELVQKFNVEIPKNDTDKTRYDIKAHKAAFVGFLKFLKANLGNQTGVRIDPAWASQTAILQGAANVTLPGHILHEKDLGAGLAHIEKLLGLDPVVLTDRKTDRKTDKKHDYPFGLEDIYNAQIESLARDAYPRDYQNFGFGNWA